MLVAWVVESAIGSILTLLGAAIVYLAFGQAKIRERISRIEGKLEREHNGRTRD